MKLSGIPLKGRRRSVLLLMAGVGTAAAMAIAPVAVGVLDAGQAAAATPTSGTTVVMSSTAATWTATASTANYAPLIQTGQAFAVCQGPAQAVVPGSALTTITTVTWLWANVGQSTCDAGRPPSVPNGTVTLTRTFTIPGIPQAATLYFAADDVATVSINGTAVALTPAMSTTTATHRTNYAEVHTATVTTLLLQGSNTVTITASNTGNPVTGLTGAPNPGGVGVYLPITWTSGTANLCKHTGWRSWHTPTFQNQGDCVSYFVHNPAAADPTIPHTAGS